MVNLNFPSDLTRLAWRQRRRFTQYAVVGFASYGITALCLELFYALRLPVAAATVAASEVSLVFTFLVNNLWTFRGEKISSVKKFWQKFIQFNLVVQGSAFISGLIVGLSARAFGDQYRQIYLMVAIGFFDIPYNFSAYNLFIWQTWKPDIGWVRWVQKRLG